MKKFYDRVREMTELRELQRQAYADNSRFVVLTGRRRVGKTSRLLILLMNLRDLSSVSSRKHQYSSGRFQYILDSNLTAVYLLQLFLCQLLSLLLIVLFILFHNCVNFKLFDLLLIALWFCEGKDTKIFRTNKLFCCFFFGTICDTAYGFSGKKWNSHGLFICFCSKRKRKYLQIRKFLRIFAAIIHYAKK